MTADERPDAEDRAERIRAEFIEAHRLRYAVTYRRRFGIDSPGTRVRRIAFFHDAEGESETARRRRLLEARGAVVEEWWPGRPVDPPAGREVHGLFVTAAPPAGAELRKRLAAAVRASLERSAAVAIAPSSLAFLALEGCLAGRRAAYPPGEEIEMRRTGVLPAESALARDGRLLTCSAWEKLPDLVRGLLDLVHQNLPGDGREA